MLLQLLNDLEGLGNARPLLAVVESGVVGEENLGLDLNKTVQDGADTVVRADSRPDGAESGSTEEGDQSLHMVGNEACHNTVLLHTSSSEGVGALADLFPQLVPCGFGKVVVVLGGGDDSNIGSVDVGISREQEVLGEV